MIAEILKTLQKLENKIEKISSQNKPRLTITLKAGRQNSDVLNIMNKNNFNLEFYQINPSTICERRKKKFSSMHSSI